MLNLWDVIDQDDAEKMLEQHDRYRFGCLLVVRDKENRDRWWAYWHIWEIHCWENPKAEPQSFPSLADALACVLSPANQERWEEIDTGRRKAKGGPGQ